MARGRGNCTSHIILYFALSGIMTPINSFSVISYKTRLCLNNIFK